MEQKKTKHITLNITSKEFNRIRQLAETENRNITNYVYLILQKAILNESFGKCFEQTLEE